MASPSRVMPKPSLAAAPTPTPMPLTLVSEAMTYASPGPRASTARDLNEASFREIYAQVATNASVARRVVQVIQARPELVQQYHSVYLKAWITIELRQEKLERNQRIGNALRRWIKAPFRLFGRGGSSALDNFADMATPAAPAQLMPSDLGLLPADARKAPPPESAPVAQATGT